MIPCSELLFFDTFSHESPPEEELNLDLVQFPSPVVVDEVRVIPLGARVQANFPGGVRLGATNPTNFDLEFFVNDLTRPGSSTFESLGVLPYRNDGKIHLGTEKKIPTDGLVLRGLYTAITLAVYGTFSKSTPEQLALQGSENTVNGNNNSNSNEQQTAAHSSPAHSSSGTPTLHGAASSASPTQKQQQQPPPPLQQQTLQHSPRPSSRRQSTESMLDDMSDIGDGDVPDAEDFCYSGAGGSRRFIKEVGELSDEDVLEWSDDEFVRLSEYLEDDPIKTLDPLASLDTNGVSLKYFRLLKDTFSLHDDEGLSDADWEKLSSSEEASSSGEWVEHIEAVTRNLLDVLRAEEDYRDRLLHYAEVGLDMEKALAQSMPTFKVRHLKSGLKLVLALVRWGGDFVEDLLVGDIYRKLLDVFEDKYMAISLRLLILRIIDSLMNYANGMESFLNSTYEKIMRLCLSKQSTRSKFALAALARKAHLNEVMEQLSDRVTEFVQGDEEELTAILEEIMDTYKEAKLRISQSDRFLPVKSHFELSDSVFYDYKPGYFSLLRNNGILHSLLILLTNPKISPRVAVAVHRLLNIFCESQEGLIFMADEQEVTNRIIEALLHTDCPLLAEKIAYRVQVLSLLDELLGLCKDKMSRRDCECPEVLLAIQDLYGLTFDDIRGKSAVAEVLGFDDNLEILIRLAKHESGKDMKKSAIRGYACELIILTIKVRQDVSYLTRFAPALVDLVKSDENSRLYELAPWLSPFDDLNRSSSKDEANVVDEENENAETNNDDDEIAITRLCDLVKKSLESFNGISPSLITSIRLLSYYLLKGDEENPHELHKTKYHFVTAFSKDLYEHFLSILAKVSSLYDQPHLRVGTLSSYRHGVLIVSLLCPLLRTLRYLLHFVIQCRGVEFQDLRPISHLLRTYALSLAFPSGSITHFFGDRIRGDIIQTILSFTQPPFDPAKHNMADSLWKKTVKEIIDYILSSPQCYIPGLRLLSEILPLPLPIESSVPLQPQDVKAAIHLRKLWSGHLFPLESSLIELVSLISGCCSSSLLRLLKRVLIQISDLSYHSSTMVTRALIDSLKKNEEDLSAYRCSLSFLASVLDNGSIKSSFLSLTLEEDKSIYETFHKVLNSNPIALQFPVFKILSRLLDSSISVTPGSVNGLPSKAQINAILSYYMDYLTSRFESTPEDDPLLEMILSSFKGLSSHEHGFYSLRTAFFKTPNAMKTIFQILSQRFNEHRVKLWLDTLKNLTSGSNHLTTQELAHLLQWKSASGGDDHHPLRTLIAHIHSEGQEYEQMETELESYVSKLESSCNSSESDQSIKLSLSLLCDNDNSFPAPESLSSQFESRVIWTLVDEDRKCLESELDYFENNVEDDDSSDDKDRIEINLLEFAEKCLPKEFELSRELENLNDDGETLAKKRKTTHHNHQPVKKSLLLEGKGLHNPKAGNTSNYKSGHRQNNGSNNGSNSNGGNRFNRSGQRIGAFRSRPPNTSRPPSLHVDDFLVLQSLGQQPTGPTGYNKQSVKAAKELFAQREAAQNKNSVVGYREATDKPVYSEQRNNSNNGLLPGSSGGSSSGGAGNGGSAPGSDSRRTNNRSAGGGSNNRVRGGNAPERSERNNRNTTAGSGAGTSSGGGGRSNYRSSGAGDRGVPRDRSSNSGRYSPRYSPLPSRDYRGGGGGEDGSGDNRRFGSNNGGPSSSSRRSGNSGGTGSSNSWGGNNDRNSRTKDRFSTSGGGGSSSNRSRNGSRNREDSRQRHMRPIPR